jgi:FAD/FMN-containing dehydrogenases
LDEVQIKAINQYKKVSHEIGPTLFVEIKEMPLSVKEQSEIFRDIAEANNILKFQWSDRSEEIEVLWSARHDAYYAALALAPGKKAFTTDICVPISNLTDCIIETKKDIEQSNIIAPIVGHVGDGNFHLIMLLDPENKKEVSEAKQLNDKLVNRALKMEGTSTGEHGIGIGKKEFLKTEQGLSVEIMSQIKKAIDPKNIMNPGKIFDIN